MNTADSEVIASIMKMADYETVDSLDNADAILLNTCSIRDNAEQKIFNRLETLNNLRKPSARNQVSGRLIIGVVGCMAERMKEEPLLSFKKSNAEPNRNPAKAPIGPPVKNPKSPPIHLPAPMTIYLLNIK